MLTAPVCLTSEKSLTRRKRRFDIRGVPRERFAPVKTCNDLLAVRSDAYKVTEDHRLVLDTAKPPNIDMDGACALFSEDK